MAKDLQNSFGKSSKPLLRKKGKNHFSRVGLLALKAHIALHVNWLRFIHAGDLAAMYLKTINLKATNAKRVDLEAVIYVSVASIVAHAAHEGQFLKADNKPYIEHPEHLASKFEDPWIKVLALVHDVLEDSDIPAQFFRDIGFPEDVVEDIELLNHKKKMPYLDYIRNIGTAKRLRVDLLKIEDLTHNMESRRAIPGIRKEHHMYKHGEGYNMALAYINAIRDGKIRKGTSIVEFLVAFPEDYILAEREDMKFLSPQKKIQYRAEQLYVARKALMKLSTEYGAVEYLWDPAIKNLIREKRLPPPRPPVITTPPEGEPLFEASLSSIN